MASISYVGGLMHSSLVSSMDSLCRQVHLEVSNTFFSSSRADLGYSLALLAPCRALLRLLQVWSTF